MAHTTTRHFSVRITRWLMEIIGFWNAQTIREQLRLRFNFACMVLVLVSSLCVELLDLYYSRYNLDERALGFYRKQFCIRNKRKIINHAESGVLPFSGMPPPCVIVNRYVSLFRCNLDAGKLNEIVKKM